MLIYNFAFISVNQKLMKYHIESRIKLLLNTKENDYHKSLK